VTEALFGPVTFGGGARWTPFASPDEPAYLQMAHAVLDVAIVLRGAVPNFDLGEADSYIWAGEWELALYQLADAISRNPGKSSDLAETMLKRAQAIMELHSEKSE
jgi:hypothetical protein